MPETIQFNAAIADVTHRRCWRCLETFAVDHPVPVREDFWLCEPCRATLLPSKERPS